MKGFYKVEDVLNDEQDWNGGTHPLLRVWIEDEEGDQVDYDDADEPEDWDGSEPAEYERLENMICQRQGLDANSIEWCLR